MASTIDETLLSLKLQTYRAFEVIIVNDGSSDPGSIKKLENLDLKGLNAQIINQKNQGVAAARNNGIDKAVGKYIVCLDSDDVLDPTYVEKCLLLLELDPNIALVSTDMKRFGINDMVYKQARYSASELIENNMVVTAAMFKKEAWAAVGGYKSNIGYEDWEFWINLAEKGYWGTNIPEPLFNYRTALSSRYTEDQLSHHRNLEAIRKLHPAYGKAIKKAHKYKVYNHKYVSRDSLLVNQDRSSSYKAMGNENKNVLITIPWMTFGGAETLIYNYCREIKDAFNITFATGLESDHEWEYKFKEITPNIYHLANLYGDKELYIEFISNYIKTRNIGILHIIHNGFTFDLLPEIRRRHPHIKIIVTMFNDRVPYFEESIKFEKYIDAYVSDNNAVASHYKRELISNKNVVVIPNGINCYDEFSLSRHDRLSERAALGISENDIAVFFVGRLSEEKNPDVFLDVASQMLKAGGANNLRFYIVGDGPMRPIIEKKLSDINSPNVTYLGYQSDVASYLAAADIFVLPSSIEGFPLSILEAMAMEVAVIASDVGAVSDVIDSNTDGIVVAAGSATEIVAAINLLKTNPGLLRDLKQNARKKAEEKYSNIALGDNYKKLYKDVAS